MSKIPRQNKPLSPLRHGLRNASHRVAQWLFWNRFGAVLLRIWIAMRLRIDYVLLNNSLHTPTNGELWLIGLLPTKPMVLDVGYYDGDFTSAVLERRPEARVVAFDPSKNAAANYRRNHAADSRVTFAGIALSNESGEREFFDYGNMCNSLAARADQTPQSSYKVLVKSLDRYACECGINHIDFLKIDAEGYDLAVLEGASGLLDRQAVDMFMFEFADGWVSSRRFLGDAVDYIGKKPYRLFRLFNGFINPFQYSVANERFDLGCMFVGVSERQLSRRAVSIKSIVK